MKGDVEASPSEIIVKLSGLQDSAFYQSVLCMPDSDVGDSFVEKCATEANLQFKSVAGEGTASVPSWAYIHVGNVSEIDCTLGCKVGVADQNDKIAFLSDYSPKPQSIPEPNAEAYFLAPPKQGQEHGMLAIKGTGFAPSAVYNLEFCLGDVKERSVEGDSCVADGRFSASVTSTATGELESRVNAPLALGEEVEKCGDDMRCVVYSAPQHGQRALMAPYGVKSD